MFKTVYVDRGSHYEILACYEGSPRHRQLTQEQWALEYATHPGYESMRKAVPGSVGGVTPRKLGRWDKEWKTPYEANLSSFTLQALSPEKDFDGVPCVFGDAVHQVMILASGPADVSGDARILIGAPVRVSHQEIPILREGRLVTVGPVEHPCDVALSVVDPAGVRRQARIRLRFR